MKRTTKFGLFAATMLASLAMMPQAHAQQSNVVSICTGGKTGVYYGVGQTIAAGANKNVLTVKVVETDGSWNNLFDASKGERCQAAIVQGDAMTAFNRTNSAEARSLRRAAGLHREYVHALCNRKSGITNLYDIKDDAKHPVAVGETGSGPWITWNNFVAVNKDYGKVPPVFEGGSVAASSVSEGSGPACMIGVFGLGSGVMNTVNDQFGDSLALVPATGKVFREAKNEKGEPLYEMKDIPSGTYPKLQPSGTFYGTKSVEVPTQRAVLVVNVDAMGKANFQSLMDVVNRVRPTIVKGD